MKEKMGKVWTIANTNLITNLINGIWTVSLTYLFSKSYREQELKMLQKNLETAQKDLESTHVELKDLDSKLRGLTITYAKLSSEYMMLNSRLSNCRFDFSSSWCFWRNQNYETRPDNTPETQLSVYKQHQEGGIIMRTKHVNSQSGADKSTSNSSFLRSVLWGMIFWNPVPKERLQQLDKESIRLHQDSQKILAESRKIRLEVDQEMARTQTLIQFS